MKKLELGQWAVATMYFNVFQYGKHGETQEELEKLRRDFELNIVATFDTEAEAKAFAKPLIEKKNIIDKIKKDNGFANRYISEVIDLFKFAVERQDNNGLLKSKLEIIEKDIIRCDRLWAKNKKFVFQENTMAFIHEIKYLMNEEEKKDVDFNIEICNFQDETLPISILDIDNKYHEKLGYDPSNPEDLSPESHPKSPIPKDKNKILYTEGIVLFKGTTDEVSIKMNPVDNKIYVWKGPKMKYVLAQGRRNRVADDIIEPIKTKGGN